MFDKREFELKKFIFRLIGFLIIVMLCKSVYDNIDDFIFIQQNIEKIPISIFISLLILQVITQLLLGLQWYKISSVIIENSNFFKILYILTTGSVIEALTPGAKIGGEATRLYYLKKEFNCKTELAMNIIIIQKSISMSVLFSICLISFVYLITKISTEFNILMKFALLMMCILCIVFLMLLLFFTNKLVDILEKGKSKFSNKMSKWVKSYSESVSKLSKNHWYSQFIISLIVWILFPLKMYILTCSVGINLNFFVILAITMSSYMIGMLPLTPGGIGTFESSMINLLLGNPFVQLDMPLALTITIVFRFITFWFVMLISLIFILLFKFLVERSG